MTTLIIAPNICLARNAMQRIVFERALRRGIPREALFYRHSESALLERCLLGGDDYIILDAHRPDLLLQCDAGAIKRIVEDGPMPLVTRWVLAGLRFNNLIED